MSWRPGESGHGVTQGFVGLMGDDEPFNGLPRPGKAGADIADVAGYLPNDLVRWPPALESTR